MTVGSQAPALQPLKIKCTRTDCDNGLHCFLQKTQRPRPHGGPCRACGEDLIDFPRVQARKVGDIKHTFQSLSKEWIRHTFWERPFDQRAINHAKRKGMRAMRTIEVEKRLRQSVGKAQNFSEGRQTPFDGNVIYYAQHAVAACCRKCIEYWHGVPMGRQLDDKEIAYLKQLILRYLNQRLPDLNEHPVKVPPIRKAKPTQAAPAIRLAKGRTPEPRRLKARHG